MAADQVSGLRTRKEEQRLRRRSERREWLYQYLLQHPCVDCGEEDPVVLEFDHLHGKEINISSAINNWSIRRVQEEIDKCDVVCANCHRKRTAVDQDWHSARRQYSG